jgi:hypothetical protein
MKLTEQKIGHARLLTLRSEDTTKGQHFYASSVAQWATTTDERDLRQLLKLMDKDGFSYNLFLVPVAHDAQYDIKMYQPQVDGTQWLGFFEVKEK